MRSTYLNLGGGNFNHRDEGWANLDYPFDQYAGKRDFNNIDIPFNLMSDDPLPIDNETVEAAYTEHTIEHLTQEAVLHVFKEVHRILVPGGVFRVAAPNAYKFYDSLAGKIPEKIADFAPSKGTTDQKELFFEWLFYHLLDKFSPKTWRTILTWPREEFFADVDKCMSWYPVTREQQERNCHQHISWWAHDKAERFLKQAGFETVSGPLLPHQSCKKALRKHYLDRTGVDFSFYIEATK
jgi:SAM-dependent methyltransferase